MTNPELEPRPSFEISEMTVEEIDAAAEQRFESWHDVYPNEAVGVDAAWVDEKKAITLSPGSRGQRERRFIRGKETGTFNAWVAKDSTGKIIGSTTPFIDHRDTQHVGSLYIDKAWYGSGVGHQLMQKVVDWLDPTKPIELQVATYNERAKAFYRKWGFEEVEGSESLYNDKIPQIKMIRQPTEEGES